MVELGEDTGELDFHLVQRRDKQLTALRGYISGFALRDPCYVPAFKHSKELIIVPFNHNDRDNGKCWPLKAYSMAGRQRLDNVRDLLTAAIFSNIPGGVLEAGVWRGGSSIMAAGTLAAYNENRAIYVCDSFQGLPRSSNPMDYDGWEISDVLSVPLSQVKQNFRESGLLKSNVKFIEGFFNVSLPILAQKTFKLAVLRADGDMYESTMDILFNLYDKISVGGFLIVDDWNIAVARKAVKHFFYIHRITKFRIEPIDGAAVYVVKEIAFNINLEWYKCFNSQRYVTGMYRTKKTTNIERTGKCREYPNNCIDEFSFQYADKCLQ
jgi:predicted O-methyltransferase YrrM